MIPNYFHSIFKSAQTLPEYFGLDFDELDLCAQDKNALNELSQQILVVISNTTGSIYKSKLDFTPGINGDTMEDVLADICVYILSNWKTSNVIATGCSLAPDKRSVQMKFHNTLLSQIISNKAWHILFTCVNRQDFCSLFLKAVVLHRLPQGAYFQLAGTPLLLKDVALKPKPSKSIQMPVDQYMSTFLFDIASNYKNIPKYLDTLLFSKKRRKSASDNQHTNKAQKLSRRQKKKLKQANTSTMTTAHQPSKRAVAIDRSQLFYSTKNADLSTSNAMMNLPKNNVLRMAKTTILDDEFLMYCMSKIFPREFNSRNKTKKFLKRCQSVQNIVKEIQTRHNRMHCSQILKRRCPKKMLIDNITRAATPHYEVFEFVKELIRRTFPLEFWGSQHNLDIIYRATKHFISRRRFEKLSMTEIMHEFKVLDCKWLAPSQKQRIVPTDLQKRKAILQQAFYWFFNDFIMPTLKSFFYITEHSKHGKEAFYYRRDTWHSIIAPSMEKLIETNYFKEMRDTEMDLGLGAGKIRFVPKERGLRMITNMKTATRLVSSTTDESFQEQKVNPNARLETALNVLHYEMERNSDIMGSSVLGRHSLYKRYKSYIKTVLPTTSKFYFVKVDISNCFDNIDQSRLLAILEDILKSGQYLCKSIASVRPFAGKFLQKSLQSYGSSDEAASFSKFGRKSKDIRPGSILVDQGSYTFTDTQELYYLLKENIASSAVKFGDKYYKRQHGIAQGSRLSTLLCSFFFGRLEQEKLAYLKEDKQGILFSYIDDFLYITKDKNYAVRFLDTMTTDLSDFRVSVNKDKCVTNLYNDMSEFSWIGMIFDTKTLNVHIDKSKRQRSDVASFMTVEYSRKPFKALLNSGVRAIKSKFYDILMNSEINSKQSISRNLYDNFEFAALKIECQVKALSNSIMGFVNEKCLLSIVIRLGQIVIPLAPHGISKSEILHLLFLAFYNVFRRRQSKYPHLTMYLKATAKRYHRSIK
ncbi:Fe2OG dioxygenase domain-containing protein [Mucor velutinosus]|uniref:Telomerase reverse transcriptase n=1 Tax=Mucor velutinosus TaxID=708070 RepID=A0AAN7D8J3_9FUNG|nr:Fe2OG dioxygenase domain-containing protein [Mucor velutinosus]